MLVYIPTLRGGACQETQTSNAAMHAEIHKVGGHPGFLQELWQQFVCRFGLHFLSFGQLGMAMQQSFSSYLRPSTGALKKLIWNDLVRVGGFGQEKEEANNAAFVGTWHMAQLR